MNKTAWRLWLFFILFPVCISGCSQHGDLPSKDERIIIMNDKNYLILDKNWNIINSIKRPSQNINTHYSYRFAFQSPERMGGPCIGYSNRPYYLESIDTNSMEIKNILIPTATLNSFCMNGDSFAVIDNRNGSLTVSETDSNGNTLKKCVLNYNDSHPQLFVDYQLIPDADGYYLLSLIIPENSPVNYVENHLLHLNEDLQIDEDIDLGVYNGGCFSMDIDFESQTAYILQTTEGTDYQTGEPGLSDNLHVIDLSEKLVSYQISLGYAGSNGVMLDPDTGKLIVRRTSFNKSDNVQFLLVDPSTWEIDTIEFDQAILDEEFLNPVFSKQNGRYIILFQNRAFIYNCDDENMQKIEFAALGLENVRGIWIGSDVMPSEGI